MNNLESFQTLLEIVLLVLTLSTESPLLGIAAAICALLYLLIDSDDSDNGEE
ncbi:MULTISPECIES: hypothetical protein [unclassified Moorena]|uniref:hypothetical protein n=1 Tax=unclassified Moorena TaxID=2683338 RepID=UPI0013FF4938|nr:MULTISPECIES: hypothetical protein [unclassified Moorena]NEO15131.1 hypothetical protein [Moorena sp. SIO3E8]NEQ02050.1 hypothetical protein [Moorena sp. SIO3F7]